MTDDPEMPWFVQFKPKRAEEWGVGPEDKFVVRGESRYSYRIYLHGRLTHVAKSHFIKEVNT